jgi:hypothetical protein
MRGNDVGCPDLTHSIVRDANHRYETNFRVLEHHPFDLGRVGIEPTHDEHVFFPVGDVDVSLVVHDRDVTGLELALRSDGLSRLLRRIENEQLALGTSWDFVEFFVDNRKFHIGPGPA